MARERRRHPRTSDSFPVSLRPAGARWLSGSVLRGTARDYDSEGACVLCWKPLPAGARVRVRLHMPRSLSELFRGLRVEFGARVVEARKTKVAGQQVHELILKWDQPLDLLRDKAVHSYQWKVGTLLALVMGSIAVMKWRTMDYFWYSPLVYAYSATLLVYLFSRFLISWRHRNPAPTGYMPSVSVVIPVRNEEKCIEKTVESCFETEYPPHLREVIVIDDGSTDATPRLLKELQERYPDLKVHTIPPTGKRMAMATGVRDASGEIVVFVDSDTFLFPSSLRQIVCGFEDPTLGASAGYTEVENADVNALTGMQEVRYVVSFKLLKSSESYFSAVTCCPGCLSAYRRKYLLEILDPWLNQTFLGAPATFGDDRSLTNYILRKYRVIYNENAVASTMVPETWRHFMHQQVRWKKSWLRETLIASRFMLKKHPLAAVSFYASSVFSLMSPAMVARIFYMEWQGYQSVFLFYVLGLIAVGLMQSLYFLYKRPSPHWVHGMLWMFSSLFITGPQTYYAMLTIRKNHWGTR